MKPCGHRVVVKPDKVEEKTESGIITMLDSQKKLEQYGCIKGTIISIGPTAWKAFDRHTIRQPDGSDKVIGGEPWASVGDRVIYSKYGGIIVEVEDEELTILNDEDVVAVL